METLLTASSIERDEDSKKPRIWHKKDIERDGNVIGGADPSSVLPGDFIILSNETSQRGVSVKLESLDVFAAADSVHTTPDATPTNETPTPLTNVSGVPKIQTYSAMMRFSMDSDGVEKKEINLALDHDVYFVTAHPCVPSHHTELLKSPTSPLFQVPEQSGPGSPGTLTGMFIKHFRNPVSCKAIKLTQYRPSTPQSLHLY